MFWEHCESFVRTNSERKDEKMQRWPIGWSFTENSDWISRKYSPNVAKLLWTRSSEENNSRTSEMHLRNLLPNKDRINIGGYQNNRLLKILSEDFAIVDNRVARLGHLRWTRIHTCLDASAMLPALDDLRAYRCCSSLDEVDFYWEKTAFCILSEWYANRQRAEGIENQIFLIFACRGGRKRERTHTDTLENLWDILQNRFHWW